MTGPLDRGQLIAALRGRADTLTHCPQCGDRAKFAYGRPDNGHEVAGWLFEKPILTCPQAPAGRFLSVKGTLITVTVHEEPRASEDDDIDDGGWAEASGG